VKLFSKKHTYDSHRSRDYYRRSAPVRPVGLAARRPLAPVDLDASLPSRSAAAARESVHELADKSRAEISDLVEAERSAMVELVAESVRTTEERLRGVAENRIDLELSRLRETEEALRSEIETTVRSEVAKTITQLRTKSRQRPQQKTGSPQQKTGSTNRGGKPSRNGNGHGNGNGKALKSAA
jgi:hypothetical protein